MAELENPRSTWVYVFSIAAFILALISLLVALLMPKGLKENEVRKILDGPEIKTKTHDCVGNFESPNSCNTHKIETKISQLESRLNQVESAVAKKTPAQDPTTNCSDPVKAHNAIECNKIGYAKVDTGTFFTTIYDSCKEGCVFKITFTSQSEGKFTIISLDKIQSRNDWQEKIQCSGVSIKEASSFETGTLGVCKKYDEKTWEVTKPLKIQLKK